MAPAARAGFAPPTGGALLDDAHALDHGLQLLGWANPAPLAQLQAINPNLGYAGTGDLLRAAYGEQAALALTFVPADATLDAHPWLLAAISPQALETAITPALAGMEKHGMCWPRLLVEAQRAWRALPAAERPTFGATSLIPLPPFGADAATPDAWMLLISWGKLRNSEAGLRTAALLEYHSAGRGLPLIRGKAPRTAATAPDVAVLQQVYDEARARELILAADPDAKKAQVVVALAAAAAALPRPMAALHSRGLDREEQLSVEIGDSQREGAFDGASRCARLRIVSILDALQAGTLAKAAP